MNTNAILIKYEQLVYAILRIVTGLLFLWHGTQKILDFPPHPGYTIPLYIIILGGGPELFGGLLIMTGLFTRVAAFICCGEMAYAYWFVHGTKAVLPLVNRGELAVLYCFLFLYFTIRGPGRFSLDNLLWKRKTE